MKVGRGICCGAPTTDRYIWPSVLTLTCFLDKKIAYIVKTTSQIVMQFYTELCLIWISTSNKSGLADLDF